uniref:Pectinesterase n=1 Tax=Anthurium amnicola TaxID=1678845 RepID=A0A1D1Y5C0_9ARAE
MAQPPSLVPLRWVLLPILAVAVFCASTTAGASPDKKVTIDAPLLTSKLRTNRTILVGPSGKEDFTSVQAAVDSVPDGNSGWIIIHVRAGVYREKVHIPESKPYIFMRGNGKGRTKIVWNHVSTVNKDSATFTVDADNFVAFGISFRNDAAIGSAGTPFNQTVAAMVAGDKVAFYHCAFYSPHNTLFDYKGRHYYESSYIQGAIDFIFGRGQSVFQGCEIFVVGDKRMKIKGSITAQNRQSAEDDSGFVFLKGKVYGVGGVYLGRAKGSHSRVVWARTYLSKTIVPEGWTNWSYDGTTENLLYGEHDCHGPGAIRLRRVSWSKQLNEAEVEQFATLDFINAKEWLPAYNLEDI